MKLVEVKENERSEYNRFVKESENGSFLQAWEWGQWQAFLGRPVFRFWITDPSGGRTGTVQLIKMPLPFGQFYLYAPYGPVFAAGENFQFSRLRPDKHQDYDGQVISNPSTSSGQVFQSILNEIISNFPDAVFVRMEPKGQVLSTEYLVLRKTRNIQPGKTLVVDLTKTEEEMLAQMHHKTRYNIRLAQKHGVKVVEEFSTTNGHGLYFKEALSLFIDTAKRQGYAGFDFRYYQKMLDFFTVQNSGGDIQLHLLKAVSGAELLAAGVMLDFGKTRTYLFGGSSEKNKNLMAPYALHFYAMLKAKSAGFKYYDFWGIETSAGDVPGFVKFKLGFGGQAKEYGGAYDAIIKPWSFNAYQGLRLANRFWKKLVR